MCVFLFCVFVLADWFAPLPLLMLTFAAVFGFGCCVSAGCGGLVGALSWRCGQPIAGRLVDAGLLCECSDFHVTPFSFSLVVYVADCPSPTPTHPVGDGQVFEAFPQVMITAYTLLEDSEQVVIDPQSDDFYSQLPIYLISLVFSVSSIATTFTLLMRCSARVCA